MILFRLAVYSVLLGVIMALLMVTSMAADNGLRLLVFSPLAPTLGTSEYSIVEWLQLAMLAMIAMLAWFSTRLVPQYRVIGYLMLSIAVAAGIREMDLFLDYYVIDHAWQLLVAVLAVVTIVYCYRHAKALRLAYARAMPSIGIALMVCGVFTLLIFANLMGHEAFWQRLMGESYLRVAKLAAEEIAELIGYWLWLVGQIEFTRECRAQYRYVHAHGERRKSGRANK